jgi:hypothetical protein
MTPHSTATFEHLAEYVDDVVRRLRVQMREGTLDLLDVLVRDGVEPLVAELRQQVPAKDTFLRRDAAGLLSLGACVPLDEPRCELLERLYLLFRGGRHEGGCAAAEQLHLSGLTPT